MNPNGCCLTPILPFTGDNCCKYLVRIKLVKAFINPEQRGNQRAFKQALVKIINQLTPLLPLLSASRGRLNLFMWVCFGKGCCYQRGTRSTFKATSRLDHFLRGGDWDKSPSSCSGAIGGLLGKWKHTLFKTSSGVTVFVWWAGETCQCHVIF